VSPKLRRESGTTDISDVFIKHRLDEKLGGKRIGNSKGGKGKRITPEGIPWLGNLLEEDTMFINIGIEERVACEGGDDLVR